MNTKLVEYGIFQYTSDYCIHVSPVVTNKIFLYKTMWMQGHIIKNARSYRIVSAAQLFNGERIITSEGYLIPCNNKKIKSTGFPCPKKKYSENMGTGEKGKLAVEIVMWCLKSGRVAFEFDVGEITDRDMQIAGNDVIAISDFRIQVKCDWAARPKSDGGTGNLFVQIKECNPNGIH